MRLRPRTKNRGRNRRSVLYGHALAALLLTALAACGNSHHTSTGSSSTAGRDSSSSSSSGTQATGTPYTIGAISTDSGLGISGTTPDVSTTVHNWVSYTNSHGGINGHPVNLIYFNDQENAANAAADAQSLIQSHVLAIMDGSFVDNAFQESVDAAKIPVLSLVSSSASFLFTADPNFFANSTTVLANVFSHTYLTNSLGENSMAMFYCAEDPNCSQAVPLEKFYGAVNHVTVPYTASISVGAPNYTAQCLAAKSSGAQSLFVAASNSSEIERVAADCANQGYTPTEISATGTIPDSFLSKPGFHHVIAEVNTFPSFVDTTAATRLYHKVMGSYLPHAQRPPLVSAAWTGMELFAAVASNAGDNPTTQSIYTGLYALNGSTLGGLAPPLTFTQGQANNVNCFYIEESTSGKYTAPKGDSPVCVNLPPLPKK